MAPGVDSASKRNEYQGYLLDGKGWQPYHLHVPIFSKSRSLNLLEPSGPVTGLHRNSFTFTFLPTVKTLNCSTTQNLNPEFPIFIFKSSARWQIFDLPHKEQKLVLMQPLQIRNSAKPFKTRIKSHLLFAGIIRSSPFSPR